MTYEEYGKKIGRCAAAVGNALNKKKGMMRAATAAKMAEGGFLSPIEWRMLTPAQKKRRWRAWSSEQENIKLMEMSQGES